MTADNRKVDGDTLVRTAQAAAGQVLQGNHGVMFIPAGPRGPKMQSVAVRYIGQVRAPSGVIMEARFFYRVEPWQIDHAEKLVHKLNYELHHDGAWSVLWKHPAPDGVPTMISMAYQDADGDVQFVVDSNRTCADLQIAGPESQIEICERAYKQFMGWLSDVDIGAGQMIKAAQGQQQKDPTIQPLI